MLGHLKHLVIVGSSLLALGVALLVVVPQKPRNSNQNCPGLVPHPRQRLALAEPRHVTVDLPGDPELDLYELAGSNLFKNYIQ